MKGIVPVAAARLLARLTTMQTDAQACMEIASVLTYYLRAEDTLYSNAKTASDQVKLAEDALITAEQAILRIITALVADQEIE